METKKGDLFHVVTGSKKSEEGQRDPLTPQVHI